MTAHGGGRMLRRATVRLVLTQCFVLATAKVLLSDIVARARDPWGGAPRSKFSTYFEGFFDASPERATLAIACGLVLAGVFVVRRRWASVALVGLWQITILLLLTAMLLFPLWAYSFRTLAQFR